MEEFTIPEDVEMPLEEHLIELGKRFILAAAVVAVFTISIFPYSDSIITFLRKDILPPDIDVITTNPTEYLYMRIQLSIVGAFFLALPIIIYELFAFMKPGLFPSERKFFIRVIPGSVILLLLGATFSYFLVTPFLTSRLISYTEGVAMPLLTLTKFISFVSSMLLVFGIIFQMPLVISFLVMADLVTIKDLTEKRKFAYAILLLGGVIFSPDPVPLTPIIVAVVLVVIYEISIVFAKAFLRA
jgi:sec-independent protein translocase protein TatC